MPRNLGGGGFFCDVQLVMEKCEVLLQLVDSDSRRVTVTPLIFVHLTFQDLIITDWSHKVALLSLFLLHLSLSWPPT